MKTFLTCVLTGWPVVCVVLLCCTPVAAADPDVLLVLSPDGKVQEGFLSALRIQLGNTYRVRVSSARIPGSLPERIALATQLVESAQALATVWMEEASFTPRSPRRAVLYVVGRRAGRALLEVVQAPGTRGLDLERMLAIKLDELLVELQAEPAHPLRPVVSAPQRPKRSPPTAAPVAASPPPPHAVEPRFWGMLQLGPRFDVALGSGWSRFGGSGLFVPELSFKSVRVGLALGAEWFPSLTVHNSRGAQVNLSEVVPRALASISWVRPTFSVGLRTGPLWSFMSVRGRTPLGRTHSVSAGVFGWSLGLRAEHTLWRSFGLGASLQLQSAAQRLYFDVNGSSVLDRGWLRLTLGIDITFRTALSRAAR